MASSGDLSSRCVKRGSSPAASVARHSASPNTSRLMAPANALGSPRCAIVRATFHVEPPVTLCQRVWAGSSTIRSIRASPAATKRGKSKVMSVLEHVQHLVAGAHRMVVDLAGRAFLVRQLGIVGRQDAVPGAMPVVDEMLPAVGPQAVVPVPEAGLARAVGQQRGRGQAFGLHPEVFVVVADGAVRAEAIVDAAVLRVP